MATEIPQRELRNRTAELLRRVEDGERLRITVHGHPVADLVPVERPATFVPADRLREAFAGLPAIDLERFKEDLEGFDAEPRDPFA